MRTFAIILFIVFSLSSCAHVISKQTRTGSADVRLFDVRDNLEKFKGSTLVLGGFIVKTTNEKEGSTLEIVQNPIDRYGVVLDRDISEGRFLAFYKGHLDPLIFKKGREVTLAGKVTGNRVMALGDSEYDYPVLEIVEIYLWKDIDYYTATTPFYSPYMFDYYTYPSYQRVYYPWLSTPLYPPFY